MARQALDCDGCAVRNRAACAALDPAERRELSTLGRHRRLMRGDIVFSAGAANELTATLIRGVLKVRQFDSDGTEHIVALIHPAGFAGELFAPVAEFDVVALSDSELCLFPRADYERALRRFPELGGALLRRSAQDLADSRRLLAAVTGRSATQRIAAFLSTMARAANDVECHGALGFDLEMTRGEIASLLGLTIETVSRQLTRLERDKVIRREGSRGIRVLDPSQLGRLGA